jgi:hypothetical protein
VIDISKNNCAVATTTVERDTPDTPFDGYKKITAPRYPKTIKDRFERQVFAMRVNLTNHNTPEQAVS